MALVTIQDDFYAALREWVSRGTGLHINNVIQGSKTTPRPSGTYATIYLARSARRGSPTKSRRVADNDQVAIDTTQRFDARVLVDFYRDLAYDFAVALATHAESDVGATDAARLNLNIYRVGDASSNNAELSGKIEERASIDFDFSTYVVLRHSAPTYAGADIRLKGDDVDETINVDVS